MRSIRTRLFMILLVATGLVWLCAVIWIQHSTETRVGQVLDRRLEESARMVASLIGHNQGVVAPHTAELVGDAPVLAGSHDYARQLICQVWGFDGKLRSASQGAPQSQLAEGGSGFSARSVNGEVWRVYSHVDEGLGIRVMVGDSLRVRDALVNDVSLGLIVPAVLILPVLALLIWWAVAQGLRPMDDLAATLARRPATDLGALDQTHVPTELRAMTTALNGLFRRVDQARERERNFTAFAAHELKTPLAGLKTQAQIAAISPDDLTRQKALAQIAAAVNRSDRLVGQLLAMTAVESATVSELPSQDGARVLADVIDAMDPLAASRGVRISAKATAGPWRTDHVALLTAALRNLLENAILASQPGAEVEAWLRQDGKRIVFEVLDRGCGIAAPDRPHVTNRFYRGAASPSGGGSGLGLAIVAAAMERMAGELTLTPREGGGERATLSFAAAS